MRRLLSSSVTSVSLLALATALAPSAALAQTTPPETPPGSSEASSQDDDPTASPEAESDVSATAAESATPLDTGSGDNTIVVTGSRIARPEFSFPNPIQSFSSETIQQSGQTNLTDFLQTTPALLGSTDNQEVAGSNLPSAQFVGVNLLNLRNLGTQRTLVLVNGRRHVAGIFGTAQVDINTIPVDLIDRIDVLTGGTSSIYGADGVSGVVNFVMKRDFEGLSVRAQAGVSQRGDAGNRFVSATWGKNFADNRGNISLSYEFNETDRFAQRQRLGWGRTGPTTTMIRNQADLPDDCTPTNCPSGNGIPDFVPSDGADLRWVSSSPGGAVSLDFDYYPDFTGEGTPYDNGIPIAGTAFTVGGDSTLREIYFGDFTPYNKKHAFNAFGSYEVSPAFRLFGEAKYVRAKGFTFAQPTFDLYTIFQGDNAFLRERFPTQIAGLEADCAAFVGDPENDPDDLPFFCTGAGGYAGGWILGRDNLDFGVRRYSNVRDTYRGVLGADGQINDHLRYEVSLNYGQTDTESENQGDRIRDRYFAAIDAVVDPATGQITCRINLPGETTIFGNSSFADEGGPPVTFQPGECIPLNIFGSGAASQAALDWVLATHGDRSTLKQFVASGYVSGDTGAFLNMPGGPIGFAAGLEYRKEKSEYVTDELGQEGFLYDNAQVSAADGDYNVKEAFAEVNIPILKDMPGAHALDVGGAIRFSDYSSIGNTVSWSTNGVWAPVRDITFRGTYSKAVRAPNISELFSPSTGTFAFIIDPCGQDQVDAGTDTRAANCLSALTALGFVNPYDPDSPDFFDPADSQSSPQNASVEGVTGGNPNLGEETAKTLTAGLVLRPRFIPGLNLAFDWYRIKIQGAVSTATAAQVVTLCYDQPTLENVFCDAISRNPTSGFIDEFDVRPENVAQYFTKGIDFSLNYRFAPWANAGQFNFKLTGNRLKTSTFIATLGADVDEDRDEAGIAIGGPWPRYSATSDLTWTKGPWTLNYGVNWFRKTRRYTTNQEAANPDIAAQTHIWYKPYWEHQVQAAFDVDQRMNIYLGVNNLWDERPDVAVTGYPVSAVGRFFYAGVRLKPF